LFPSSYPTATWKPVKFVCVLGEVQTRRRIELFRVFCISYPKIDIEKISREGIRASRKGWSGKTDI
jgi:hypothetical protein